MIFTKEQVKASCNAIAPEYGLDPDVMYALAWQESTKTTGGSFAPDRARLEEGFYLTYVEQMDLATTTEGLLAMSYGIFQVMGEVLRELGYFDWYFQQLDPNMKNLLQNGLSEFGAPSAINKFCVTLDWQTRWACKHFANKLKLAKGNLHQAFLYWNGGGRPAYADEVDAKLQLVKAGKL